MSEYRDRNEEAPSGASEGPPWKLIALLALVILLAVFFFQNTADTSVSFLWLDGEWPVWLVIGVSVVIGMVLARLLGWQWRRARRRKAEN
jgi:uncharacterized integral membrane protein